MKAVGIICEYNPFHQGHKYHIEKAKEQSNCDTVVAVMSGNFVQRGDVAVYDKSVRAEATLRCGADLVLELPVTASLSRAEHFASFGINILNALSVVDYVAFGAENDNLEKLTEIAALLVAESPDFKDALASFSAKGLPFASARAKAVELLISGSEHILSSPNNILAIEYLKALIKTKSTIAPVAILRQGEEYNSSALEKGFISATGARKLIKKGESLDGFVPHSALALYKNAKIHTIENMESAIIANLCKMTSEEIAQIPDVSEGLENKIKKEAMVAQSFDELCGSIKSKRYAHSRIRRILLHSYLGITKEDLVPPQYIKILGFNSQGQKLLNKAKQEAKLPLAKNFNQIKALNNPFIEEIWKKELIFDRIYDLF